MTPRHRWSQGRFATAAVMALLIVAACSTPPSPTPTPSPSANQESSPAASATAVTTPAPSAAASPTASEGPIACASNDLDVVAGPVGGGAGSRGADVTVTARGADPCQLPAAPVVEIVDATGTVRLVSKLPTSADGPLLAPGTAATFAFEFSNWCDTTTPLPIHAKLALAQTSPDVAGLIFGGDDLPPCNGPGQPAAISTTAWTTP